MLMSNLVDYLLELAADPDRCARFKADPESELRYTALSDAEKAAITSRDPRRISEVIADQNPDSGTVLQWMLSVFSQPGG
jgi:hypothetical protein